VAPGFPAVAFNPGLPLAAELEETLFLLALLF
jgi:hypothetical protein